MDLATMPAQSDALWDRMNYATQQVVLHVLRDSYANSLAKDVARCVLSDNGCRRLECEDHYDRKIDPVNHIAEIFKAFCTSSKFWGPQVNRLFRKNVQYFFLAEWWIHHVRKRA